MILFIINIYTCPPPPCLRYCPIIYIRTECRLLMVGVYTASVYQFHASIDSSVLGPGATQLNRPRRPQFNISTFNVTQEFLSVKKMMKFVLKCCEFVIFLIFLVQSTISKVKRALFTHQTYLLNFLKQFVLLRIMYFE